MASMSSDPPIPWGETGIVLDVRGGGELTAGGDPVGKHAFVEGGGELGAGEVDGCGVGGGAGANDCNLGMHFAAGREVGGRRWWALRSDR